MTTYFHYTKGYNIGLIIMAGKISPLRQIQPERKEIADDCVWLTRDDRYPITALPRVPDMPESHIEFYLEHKGVAPDMLQIAARVGGIWRFAFDRRNVRGVTNWYGSIQRKRALQKPFGAMLESVAKQVGDRTECWAFSQRSLTIANSNLQQLTPQGWVDRICFTEDEGNLVYTECNGASMSKIAKDSALLSIKLGR